VTPRAGIIFVVVVVVVCSFSVLMCFLSEFCSHEPGFYRAGFGKGPLYNMTQFLRAVTFHYVAAPAMMQMYRVLLAGEAVWPLKDAT
jgi:hypothetical protein